MKVSWFTQLEIVYNVSRLKETRDHRLPQNSDLGHPVEQPFLPVPYLWKDNSTFDRVAQVRNTATDVQQNLLVGELLNQ